MSQSLLNEAFARCLSALGIQHILRLEATSPCTHLGMQPGWR